MAAMPELMLDTNVCGKLVACYRDELPAIVRRMNRDFRVVASPNTFAELLIGMMDGDPAFFDSDKERIRLMLGTKALKFLLVPVAFVFKKALNIDIPDLTTEKEHEQHARCVLHANSPEQLFGTGVLLPDQRRHNLCSFDRELYKANHQSGIDSHNQLMRQMRDQAIGFPSQRGYAKGLAINLKQDITEEQVSRLAEALSAVYEYDKELFNKVSQSDYKCERNKGDWVDGGQLFYLADANLYILTDDGDILKRIDKNAQKSRIILLREFLKYPGFQVRH